MFGFKKKTTQAETTEKNQEPKGLFNRLKKGLAKTGSGLTSGMGNLLLGKKAIDDELLEELETRLLMADVGMEATTEIIDKLTDKVSRNELADAESLYRALGQSMVDILKPCDAPLAIDPGHKPFVILVVGINGAGKTTTIGKLANHLKADGKSVMLAAGDTFRAAAVDQLQVWGERNDIPVIAQGSGADSASVIYDAVSAASARGIDVLIADTAGRLHTQDHLMEELKKVKRVIAKIDASAPHETLLIVDGGTGQNALKQAEAFNAAIGLTGIAVTKLDGTAKGGILLAVAKKLGLPIRFIGVGESIEDLRVFDAEEFVEALLAND
ncbi:MAG: signal recognition particle-docking protein FtsY [Thiotrichales bacterium]